jgi:hypothetical protein
VDLYTIFDSVKPDGAVIHSVKIYPSEFGKERLEKENREGPPVEIFKKADKSDVSESESESENEGTVKPFLKPQVEEDDEFDQEALRKYQLERLR